MPQATESAGQQDAAFMQMALDLARQAAAAGEVPVGAVVVKDGHVVGVGCNSPIHSSDPSAHAEIMALRAAATALKNYRLDDCTLYVTLEPCAMCSGGILHGRLKRVVFGAADLKTGCAGSVINLFANPALNHHTQVEGGLFAAQASRLLEDFFRQRRAQQKESSCPTREDALRAPDRCFEVLPAYPWAPRYVSDLPSLAGLRMHFLDEGNLPGAVVYVCLHPVPGWSYSCRQLIQTLLEAGNRVVAPDLIGFGRSDKPKRADFHTLEFHLQCVLELIERLGLNTIVLVTTHDKHWLAKRLLAQAPHLVQCMQVQPVEASTATASQYAEFDAPFPDIGHRAAPSAFAAKGWR